MAAKLIVYECDNCKTLHRFPMRDALTRGLHYNHLLQCRRCADDNEYIFTTGGKQRTLFKKFSDWITGRPVYKSN